MTTSKCEGCEAPATRSDSDGVPLCQPCFDALVAYEKAVHTSRVKKILAYEPRTPASTVPIADPLIQRQRRETEDAHYPSVPNGGDSGCDASVADAARRAESPRNNAIRAAIRVAFDYPTIANIEAVALAAEATEGRAPTETPDVMIPGVTHDIDGDRWEAAPLPSSAPQPELTHSLTLEFRRVLTEAEWRLVVAKARCLPYVQGLRADAVSLSAPSSPETDLRAFLDSEEFDAAMYSYRTYPFTDQAGTVAAFENVKSLIMRAALVSSADRVSPDTEKAPSQTDRKETT